MTSPDDEIEAFGKAVIALTEACMAIAQHFDVCPLCLMYSAAEVAQDAEESGSAQHHNAVRQTHPAHKTVL